MTYVERLRQQIRKYAPQDRPALIEFQREVFGPQALQLDESRFTWLFEENPSKRPEGPQIWVCKRDGQVVGQQAGMPFRLRVGSEYMDASWAIDLMVHPRWRLRGVGPMLTKTFVASNDVTVALGISDEAYKAFLRAGWTDAGAVCMYVRPIHLGRLIEAHSSHRRLLRYASTCARPLLLLADAMCAARARRMGVVLRPIERFDHQVDVLWNAVEGLQPVLAERSLRSLRWRFDAPSVRERYQRFYLLVRERVQGYAVVRMGVRYGAPAGIIVDYLGAPEHQATLLACCVEYFREKGAAAVYCGTVNHAGRFAFRSLGFVRRPSGIRFMVALGNVESPLQEAVLDSRNWFVTAADSDQDRPDREQGWEVSTASKEAQWPR
jgi:GNAT superfamily N-acetyltransferase